MEEKSYYIAEVSNEGNKNEKVVIKFYSNLTKNLRVHKVTSFLEKYPKSTNKNLKIANNLVSFLNYIQENIECGKIKSLEFVTLEDCSNYLNKAKEHITHADLNAQKRLFTKFMYFLAKNQMLIKVRKSDFKFDVKAGKDVLKIPF